MEFATLSVDHRDYIWSSTLQASVSEIEIRVGENAKRHQFVIDQMTASSGSFALYVKYVGESNYTDSGLVFNISNPTSLIKTEWVSIVSHIKLVTIVPPNADFSFTAKGWEWLFGGDGGSGTVDETQLALAIAEQLDLHTDDVDPHTQYQLESEKGEPLGYTPLNNLGKIDGIYLPATSTSLVQEYYTLTSTDISNKYIVLDNTPSSPLEVDLIIYGGISQKSGVDFTISGNILDWNSLALELLLETGSIIKTVYQT